MKNKLLNPTATPKLLTLICTLSFIACDQSTYQQALKATIEESNALWMEAVAQRNADSAAAFYTDDAYLVPPNSPVIQGKEGIRNFFVKAMDSGIRKVRLVTEDVVGDGRIAIEKGTYEMMTDGDVVVDRGNYLVHWKNSDGKWMVYRDMYNSNLPVPTSAHLAKGSVLGLHITNIKLKPGVSVERFLDFYNTTVIPEFSKHWPDAKVFTVKAVRGDNKNDIGILYYFESEHIRKKYFTEDGRPTSVGLAVLEKMEPTFDRLEKDYGRSNGADTTAYTDWIVQ